VSTPPAAIYTALILTYLAVSSASTNAVTNTYAAPAFTCRRQWRRCRPLPLGRARGCCAILRPNASDATL